MSASPAPATGCPRRGLDRGRVGRLRHRRERPRRRRAGEQPVGVEVQPGETSSASRAQVLARVRARSSSSASTSAARSRIRRGSTSSTWASDGQQVGEQVLLGRQPRQPRLHAVEHEPLAEALPLLAAPGLGGHQLGGPEPHVVGGQQLAGREDGHLVEVGGGALVVDRELGEAIDLVAPQVDADRRVGGRREDVDDRAPAGHLAPVLDQFLAAVAHADQPLQHVVGIEHAALGDDDRLDVGDVRAEALQEGPHRRHDDAGRLPPCGAAARGPACRRPMVSTAGLTRSNGSVSHAGNSSTASGLRYWPRSSTRFCAAVPVGRATTMGWRSERWASAAMVTARAASGTARTAACRPATWRRAGSSRRSGGRAESWGTGGRSAYRPPVGLPQPPARPPVHLTRSTFRGDT